MLIEITSFGRRGSRLLKFDPWLIRCFFSVTCLAWPWNTGDIWEILDGGDAESFLPSDNDASLLAVNHCIHVRAGRTTGQQPRQLLGTSLHGSHANQAHVPGKSGLSQMAIFAMSVERSSTEEPTSDAVSNIACCWQSRTPTSYDNDIPVDSSGSLIFFLLPWLHLHNNYIM